jgi:hypothetical protein
MGSLTISLAASDGQKTYRLYLKSIDGYPQVKRLVALGADAGR